MLGDLVTMIKYCVPTSVLRPPGEYLVGSLTAEKLVEIDVDNLSAGEDKRTAKIVQSERSLAYLDVFHVGR